MIYGLLIEVDFSTGHRAGGLDPRDKNLLCSHGWQNTEDGVEIRIVVDGDPERYRDLAGVTVLDGADAVDRAVESIQTPANEEEQYVIVREGLMCEYIRQTGTDIHDLGSDHRTWAKKLYDKGCVGVVKRPAQLPPTTCSDFAEALGLKGERFKQNAIKRIQQLRARRPDNG